MWILILTLFVHHGAALTTAEFETYEACVDAGKQWTQSNVLKTASANRYSYQCVYKGKKK